MNPTIEDFLMACRYGYYEHGVELINDYAYDKLETVARRILPESSPIHQCGGDGERGYTEHQKAIWKALKP